MNFKLLGQTGIIKIICIYRLNIKKGSVAGIPPELSTLLLVSINQKPPYDITIGILDTKLWSENMLGRFYLIVRDARGLEGSVQIDVEKSACGKSQETDKSTSARAQLKVVQSSMIIRFMREEDRIIVAETTTKNIYSIFNGVEGLKSAEFVGFRIPTGNNIYLQGQGFPITQLASI